MNFGWIKILSIALNKRSNREGISSIERRWRTLMKSEGGYKLSDFKGT